MDEKYFKECVDELKLNWKEDIKEMHSAIEALSGKVTQVSAQQSIARIQQNNLSRSVKVIGGKVDGIEKEILAQKTLATERARVSILPTIRMVLITIFTTFCTMFIAYMILTHANGFQEWQGVTPTNIEDRNNG